MKEHKQPHEQLTVQDNQLTATQEVLYHDEFKRADSATKRDNQNKQKKNM
ncbi:YfhE family protein [Ureibacillus chungkukjangi]|uniref:YfhE-like protein n=1 Tax=Ureibacillus chungkukjangi TaxID=1202712 RepID=A0A318TR03_9BACL|nr:YfhE family protein [Ureibacillus chungkukjangi]MCM3390081.1 YfhE family protein [Ureibacillus chungkukjangi]PYF07251.1 YfhE-like protein [Ureibacillus chungkukjangi]